MSLLARIMSTTKTVSRGLQLVRLVASLGKPSFEFGKFQCELVRLLFEAGPGSSRIWWKDSSVGSCVLWWLLFKDFTLCRVIAWHMSCYVKRLTVAFAFSTYVLDPPDVVTVFLCIVIIWHWYIFIKQHYRPQYTSRCARCCAYEYVFVFKYCENYLIMTNW